MNTSRSKSALAILLLLTALAAMSAAPLLGQAATPPSAADFTWLSGDWVGKMGDSLIEEIWSEPAGGTLVGMFRWSTDEGVRVYELLSIEDSDKGPVLYLRHFSAGLSAWEEEAMPLELDAFGEGRASFQNVTDGESTRLTYERTPGGGLNITLDKVEGAKKSSTTFAYERRQ